tara:strand:+ start:937 stop:1566 length:630 start_codon:yes stop_codon:yes gene_type:complete
MARKWNDKVTKARFAEARRSKKAWRVNRAYREYIRTRRCLFSDLGECFGDTQAAHVRIMCTGGMGIKPPDHMLIPMCAGHHLAQHQGHRPTKDDCARAWEAWSTWHIGFVPGPSDFDQRRAMLSIAAFMERRATMTTHPDRDGVYLREWEDRTGQPRRRCYVIRGQRIFDVLTTRWFDLNRCDDPTNNWLWLREEKGTAPADPGGGTSL